MTFDKSFNKLLRESERNDRGLQEADAKVYADLQALVAVPFAAAISEEIGPDEMRDALTALISKALAERIGLPKGVSVSVAPGNTEFGASSEQPTPEGGMFGSAWADAAFDIVDADLDGAVIATGSARAEGSVFAEPGDKANTYSFETLTVTLNAVTPPLVPVGESAQTIKEFKVKTMRGSTVEMWDILTPVVNAWYKDQIRDLHTKHYLWYKKPLPGEFPVEGAVWAPIISPDKPGPRWELVGSVRIDLSIDQVKRWAIDQLRSLPLLSVNESARSLRESANQVFITGEVWSDDPGVLKRGKMPMEYVAVFKKRYSKLVDPNSVKAVAWLEGGEGLQFKCTATISGARELARVILEGDMGMQLSLGRDVYATRWEFVYGGKRYSPPENFVRAFDAGEFGAGVSAFPESIRVTEGFRDPPPQQIKVAKSTLLMSDQGARVLGGITKDEAREVLQNIGWSAARIAAFENSGASHMSVYDREAVKPKGDPRYMTEAEQKALCESSIRRDTLEREVWKRSHADQKSGSASDMRIMWMDPETGGTVSGPIARMPDAYLISKAQLLHIIPKGQTPVLLYPAEYTPESIREQDDDWSGIMQNLQHGVDTWLADDEFNNFSRWAVSQGIAGRIDKKWDKGMWKLALRESRVNEQDVPDGSNLVVYARLSGDDDLYEPQLAVQDADQARSKAQELKDAGYTDVVIAVVPAEVLANSAPKVSDPGAQFKLLGNGG